MVNHDHMLALLSSRLGALRSAVKCGILGQDVLLFQKNPQEWLCCLFIASQRALYAAFIIRHGRPQLDTIGFPAEKDTVASYHQLLQECFICAVCPPII